MFITFEGPEGGGKSTQITRLAAWLREAGHNVLCTREPGGTPVGDQIRAVLLHPDNAMAPSAEFLLYSASRAQHVNNLIRPHLAQGGIVLCDRFADSSVAYQGYGRQLDLEALRAITQFATGGLVPDLTLLLDIDPAEGLARRARSEKSLDRLDAETLSFHERVRAGYLRLMAESPGRWRRIDASQDTEAVAGEIQAVVKAWLAARGK